MGYPRRHNRSVLCTPQHHSFYKSNRFWRHENWWATPSALKTHLPAYAEDEAEVPQLSAKFSSAEAPRAADVQAYQKKLPSARCQNVKGLIRIPEHPSLSSRIYNTFSTSRVGSRVLSQVKLDNRYAKWIGNGTWRSEWLIASEIKDPLVSYQTTRMKLHLFLLLHYRLTLQSPFWRFCGRFLSLMVRSFLGHGRHDFRYRGCDYRAWSKFMVFFLLPIITVNASGVSLLQRF